MANPDFKSKRPFRASFTDAAKLDRAMNAVLGSFIHEQRRGYRKGMTVKAYTLYEGEYPLAQNMSAGLLSEIRKVVDLQQLLKLRRSAGLDEEGFSDV